MATQAAPAASNAASSRCTVTASGVVWRSGASPRRHSDPERAEVGRRTPAALQRLRQQPRAGRLAVGAGDAGDGEVLRGGAEEAIGDDTGTRA